MVILVFGKRPLSGQQKGWLALLRWSPLPHSSLACPVTYRFVALHSLTSTMVESAKINTSPVEGPRITRPGGGHNLSPAISAPRKARSTKLGRWVGPHKNSLWCKFSDPRSTSSRSNYVINAKFSHFLVKRAALCFSRPRAQTKTEVTRVILTRPSLMHGVAELI